MCFLDLPTCFGRLLRATTLLFPSILTPAYWSYLFGHISLFCPLAWTLLVWFFVRVFRVIFSALVVHPKTDLLCLSRIRHNLSSSSLSIFNQVLLGTRVTAFVALPTSVSWAVALDQPRRLA